MVSRPYLASRHPLGPPSHLKIWLLALAVVGCARVAAAADGPKPQKKQPLAEQFLVFGTVFDERGLALAGAEIRIRRAGEKKVRWEAQSDNRGEFGIRVPTGAEYDLTLAAKGFAEESRKIDARNAKREDLVFRLKPAPKGEKK